MRFLVSEKEEIATLFPHDRFNIFNKAFAARTDSIFNCYVKDDQRKMFGPYFTFNKLIICLSINAYIKLFK